MTQKFQRATPEVRQDLLIKATLRCVTSQGRAGLSVRQIAKEANVSLGLVNHHFGSLEALLARAYKSLAGDTLALIVKEMNAGGKAASRRLENFLLASFSPAVLNPDLLSAWIVFWSMARDTKQMAEAHQETYNAYVETLERLLIDLASEEKFKLSRSRLAAIAFSAILDGLWLELSLATQSFTPDDALHICRRWVDALRKGAFA